MLLSCDNKPVDSTLVNQLSSQVNTDGGGNTGGGSGVFKVDFGGQTWVATVASANIYNCKIELAGMKGVEGFGFSLTGTTTGTYNALNTFLSMSLIQVILIWVLI